MNDHSTIEIQENIENSNALYTSAANLLEDLNKNHGLEISAPLNVDRVAEILGISIISDVSLASEGIIGQILFDQEKPVIKINPFENTYSPRRRFTLAHEIGHYCLHSAKSKTGFTDSKKTMSRTSSYWDTFETEANTFAAELLMPMQLILEVGRFLIDEYKELNKTDSMPASIFTEKMADSLEVSSVAMRYRLNNLGITK